MLSFALLQAWEAVVLFFVLFCIRLHAYMFAAEPSLVPSKRASHYGTMKMSIGFSGGTVTKLPAYKDRACSESSILG